MTCNLHNVQKTVKPFFASHALAVAFAPCKPCTMRIRLKEFRKRLGLSLEAMAERTEVSTSQLSRWESGSSNIPSERLPELAVAYQCRIADIFEEEDSRFEPLGPTLYVKGEVAAGVWKEAIERDPSEWERFTGRSDVNAPLQDRGGMRVVGESMNDLYPHGSIIEYVKLIGGAELESGKRVIVQRERSDGSFEVTVKEYVIDGLGREWLVPRSSHPEFQSPFLIGTQEHDVVEVRILAVVVSSVRPE